MGQARRVILTSVGVTGAVVAIAGCGSDGMSDDPLLQALKRAAKADDVYGVRTTISTRSSENGESVRGYAQAEAGERRSRMVMAAEGAKLEQITDEPFTIVNAAGVLERRQLDALPRGVKWIKANQDVIYEAAGAGPARELEFLTPGQALEFVIKLDPKIIRAGSESIGGVPTTRYRTSVRFEDFAKEVSKRVENPPKLTDNERGREIRLVFWIDGKDLVRRGRLRVQTQNQSLVMTQQVTAFDPNLRVRIPTGPSVHDVTDQVAADARKERKQRGE